MNENLEVGHWIVVCTNRSPSDYGSQPRNFREHPSEWSAKQEAARLAREHPLSQFTVYASRARFYVPDPVVEVGHLGPVASVTGNEKPPL